MRIRNKPKILRILLSVSHNSGPFNQFFLPSLKLIPDQIRCLTLNSKIISQDFPHLYDAKSNIFLFIKSILKSLLWSDVLHLHHANLLPIVLLAKLSKNKIVFTLGTEYKNLKLHHKILLRIFSPYLNHLVACSSCVKEGLIQKGYKNVMLIRHGINLDECQKLYKNTLKINKKNICYAGRLNSAKNVTSLCESFLSILDLNHVTLSIAGEGKDKDKLNSLIINSNSKNKVKLLGQLTRDSVRKLFLNSQFYISLSKSDGMPIAVLESIACGCIPILLNTSPHLELSKLGIKFISITSNNKKDITNSILNALNLSETELSSIRKHNDSQIAEFSSIKMFMNYIKSTYIN